MAGIKSTGGSARRDAIVQLAESVGGRMESFDFAFGRSDVVTICELPDNAAAAAVALAVNGSGAVSIRTTVLLEPRGGRPGVPAVGRLPSARARSRGGVAGDPAA